VRDEGQVLYSDTFEAAAGDFGMPELLTLLPPGVREVQYRPGMNHVIFLQDHTQTDAELPTWDLGDRILDTVEAAAVAKKERLEAPFRDELIKVTRVG